MSAANPSGATPAGHGPRDARPGSAAGAVGRAASAAASGGGGAGGATAMSSWVAVDLRGETRAAPRRARR